MSCLWKQNGGRAALLSCAGWLLLAGAARAAGLSLPVPMNPEARAKITVGCFYGDLPFDGYAPLEITIVNNSGERETWTAETSSPGGYTRSSQSVLSADLTVENGHTRTFKVLAPLHHREPYAPPLTVLVKGYGISGSTQVVLPFQGATGGTFTRFVAMSEALASKAWTQLEERSKSAGWQLAGAQVSLADLPEDWRALAGVDVFHARAAELAALGPGQRAALRDYIARGGELVIYGAGEPPAEFRQTGFGSVGTIAELEVNLDRTALSLRRNDGRGEWFPNTYRTTWGSYGLLGELKPNVLLLTLYMLAFAIVVGPVNLFVFARHGRRARLFWTTPALSLAASALLFVTIMIQDGLGGDGVRLAVIHLLPAEKKAVVVQEQVSRTGLLTSSSFTLREPGLLVPISTETFLIPKNATFSVQGNSYAGDWFRSRTVQGQWIESIVPTRAEVTVVSPGEAAAPTLVSSIDATLKELYYRDANDRLWVASAVRTGDKVTLQPVASLPAFDKHAGLQLQAFRSRRLEDRDFFYAIAEEPKLFIETLPGIRWQKREALILGPVTGGRP